LAQWRRFECGDLRHIGKNQRRKFRVTPGGSYHAQVKALQRSIVELALQETDGNHAEAARALDVSPSYFRRLARDLNVYLP